MSIYSSEENLLLVRQAISELVLGKRKVSVEYTAPDGNKTRLQYTEVSLNDLRGLERSMLSDLYPEPIISSVNVEIEF